MTRLVNAQSRFGPTIESESLPVVGADRMRQHRRAVFWRAALFGLALFWGGVFAIALQAVQ